MEGTNQEIPEGPSRHSHRQCVRRSCVPVYTANDAGDERKEPSRTKAVYHDKRHERGDARRRGPDGEHAECVDGEREDESGDRPDRVAQCPESDTAHCGGQIERGQETRGERGGGAEGIGIERNEEGRDEEREGGNARTEEEKDKFGVAEETPLGTCGGVPMARISKRKYCMGKAWRTILR